LSRHQSCLNALSEGRLWAGFVDTLEKGVADV
jgi:hypothetical protein